MAKYVVLIRGGSPKPEEREEHMRKWGQWFSAAFPNAQVKGDPLQDTGKIVSGKRASTVKDITMKKDTVGGYIVIEADSYEQACAKMKGCPIFHNKGKAEIREVMPMPGM